MAGNDIKSSVCAFVGEGVVTDGLPSTYLNDGKTEGKSG